MDRQELEKPTRTSAVYTEEKDTATDRTCPVYTKSAGELALEDVTKPKPPDEDREIDISWIDKALDQKAFETKYSAWDKIYMPQGLWHCSCFGNGIGLVIDLTGKVAITKDGGTSWQESTAIPNIVSVAYGYLDDPITSERYHRFIAITNEGLAVVTSNGIDFQPLDIPVEPYRAITFFQGRFITISSNGKFYFSEDLGTSWLEEPLPVEMELSLIATNNKDKIILIGNNGQSLYSNNAGRSWDSLDIVNQQWVSVTYGEGKFIAISIDGDNQIAILDVTKDEPVWHIKQAPRQDTWRSISYGSRVFVAVSEDGNSITSFDGIRWLEIPSPMGEWVNILRTSYFFIAFSIGEDKESLNAMRSANGGALGIHFATLEEIKQNEQTDKAISIGGLNGFFDWKELEVGIKAQDVRITLIDNSIEEITSYNDIMKRGDYLVKKTLEDNPPFDEVQDIYLSVREVEPYVKPVNNDDKVLYQIAYNGRDLLNYKVYYVRRYDKEAETFTEWQKLNIIQSEIEHIDLSLSNISISKESVISACRSFVGVDTASAVVTFDEFNLSDNKVTVNKTSTISASNSFLVEDNQGNIAKISDIDLSDSKIHINNETTISACNSFVGISDNTISKFNIFDLSDDKIVVSKSNRISASQSFMSIDMDNNVSTFDELNLSDNKINVDKETVISACNSFLGISDNAISKFNNFDLSDTKVTTSKDITNSATNTFLVTDEIGNIYKLTKTNLRLDNTQIDGLGSLALRDSVDLRTEEVTGIIPPNKLIENEELQTVKTTSNIIVQDRNNQTSILSMQELLDNTGNMKYVEIREASPIQDCNELLEPAIYIVKKSLYNMPPNIEYNIIKVIKVNQFIYQIAYKDLGEVASYYSRELLPNGVPTGDWLPYNLNLDDVAFNGVWQINQGGTGNKTGYKFQHMYTMDEIRVFLGLENRAYTTQEFIDILNSRFRLTGLVFTIPFVLQSLISDLPDNAGGMLQFIGANSDSCRLYYYYPHNSIIYVNQSINQKAKGWVLLQDYYYGMNLNISNGFTWSGRQLYVHMYTYDQIFNNSMNLQVGDVLIANSAQVNLNGADSDTVWYFTTKFPKGGTYYCFFYQFLSRHNNKCTRIWQGKFPGGSAINSGINNKDSFFMGYIQKIA